MGAPIWDAAWQQAWTAFLVFWNHWYGKFTVSGGGLTGLAGLLMWFAKTRKVWHEGTAAKLEVERIRKETQRNDKKDSVANYIRLHVGAVAGDVAKELHIDTVEAIELLMELKRDQRVWHTNNGRWNFGSKPDGF